MRHTNYFANLNPYKPPNNINNTYSFKLIPKSDICRETHLDDVQERINAFQTYTQRRFNNLITFIKFTFISVVVAYSGALIIRHLFGNELCGLVLAIGFSAICGVFSGYYCNKSITQNNT